MKKILMPLLCLTLLLAMALDIKAETELKITGQIRQRGEADKKSFLENDNVESAALLRTRVNFNAIVDSNTQVFIQLQDSRTLGYPESGDLNDRRNVDLHQAYIKIDNLLGKNWGAKFGRFEFNLNNQRVFGAVGWNNVGRAWDGGMFWFKNENIKVNFTTFKKVEVNHPGYNADFDIYGLVVDLKKTNLTLFNFYEFNADTTNLATDIKRLARGSFGLFYQRDYNNWDFTLNGVYQYGTRTPAIVVPLVTSEYDIAAFMFTFETGYSFEDARNTRFALGIDYASGDDDLADSDWKTYDNLYYTAHKFSGYMDYFIGGGPNGLIDMMLRLRTDLIRGWTFRGDLHLFSAAQDYDGLTAPTKDIGTEIDLSVTTKRIKGISLEWGASVFMPKDDFAGFTNNEMAYWIYEQATVNF